MSLPLLIPDWPAPKHVRAAMTTRQGGVSVGSYASLNLGLRSGDDPARVQENRRRLREALQLPGEPVWLKQVHGPEVVRISREAPKEKVSPRQQESRQGHAPEADGSYTTQAGTVCAVQAADCLPVLFCDDAGTVVAAAHAGWRGLSAGILQATVRALPAPLESLMAWMGAAIGPQAFEVGPEVREAFVSRDPNAVRCFRPKGEGKYLADLYGLARLALGSAGVTRVYGGDRCTYRETERFFSYRRDGRCGRMAALVWLSPASSTADR